MSPIEIYSKSNELIAAFNTYCEDGSYYACATKHCSTKECIYALGWPSDKPYLQFFEKAYEHTIEDDIACSWPRTTSESKFRAAIMQFIKLPKVAKVKYDGHEYGSTSVPNQTASACIKLDDKIKFILPSGDSLTYTVQITYLSMGGCNDRLFKKLDISNKDKFMEDIYGYAVTGGMWPEFKRKDYAWWHKFAKEMIMRGVTIYINDVLYIAPKDSEEGDVSKRPADLKERLDALDAAQFKRDAVSSLKKSLKCASKVKIVTKTETYNYRCERRYLICSGGPNSQVFIDKIIHAGEFCKICYGYRPVYGFGMEGIWPECKEDDYDALYKVLCGIVYTNIGRVYIDDVEITNDDALRVLSSSQMHQLSLLVYAEERPIHPHIICHETPLKSDVPCGMPEISVSSELKLEIHHKHKVQL